MNGTIRLDDIALFVEVAQAGSMSQVAAHRTMPKSTISRTIRRLEEQLGYRLMERSTRHLRLTQEGKRLLEQTQPLLGRLNEAIDYSINTDNEPQGKLSICSPYEWGLLRLGDIITQLLNLHPMLEIELELTSRLPDSRVGNYDIVFHIQSGALPDSDQIAKRVYSIDRGLFASPDLVRHYTRPLTLDSLAELPCLSSPDEPIWTLLGPDGQQHAFTPVSRLTTSNARVRLQAMTAGLGIGLMSKNYCSKEVSSGQLIPVLPHYRPIPALVYALMPTRRLMPAKVKVFLDALEHSITTQPS